MSRRGFRIRLIVQVAAVVTLFAAALHALWSAGRDAVEHDRKRAETLKTLSKADDALAVGGARGLTIVPDWPDTLDVEDWETLDLWLSAEADKSLRGWTGLEGGYFLPSIDRYLGRRGRFAVSASNKLSSSSTADPPSREFDLIDEQVHSAFDRKRPIDRLIDTPTVTLAIRAAPLLVNGRLVAVTWTLARIDEPGGFGRSVRSYQWASWLALGGIVLALLLTASLALTVRRQIAERERMEVELRRQERLAALGTLVSGVSHELRNPLAGVRSATQLWQRGIVSDDELASELIAEVDRLEAIVGQMLQFSRAEPRSLAPGDLNEVMTEAARLVRSLAEARNVRVETEWDPKIPKIELDPAALLQVVRNLTTNALEAMPAGGTLRLSTQYLPGKEAVLASVTDTGTGLSRKVRDHLFEPFFTTKEKGTGLGLAIAREIVLAHRGELRAENDRDGGAVFTLTFPQCAALALEGLMR